MPLAALCLVFLGFPQGLPGENQCHPSWTSFPRKLTRGLRNCTRALVLELHWPPLSSQPTSWRACWVLMLLPAFHTDFLT